MDKQRIIIDMDDVLADANKKILENFNLANGMDLKKEFFADKSYYDFVHQYNYEPVRQKLFEPGFFRNLEVIEDAVEVVKELHEKHEVFIVSAAMEFPNSLIEKYDWLGEHFSFISWKNICLCGDKSIIKGDVMIDDHEKNLVSFEGKPLLFDAMHNQTLKGYQRVLSWKEVHQYFFS